MHLIHTMKRYLFKSKVSIQYILFILFDAINMAIMAVLLKDTLDAALSGQFDKLRKVAFFIILFMAWYSTISLCMRRTKARYLSDAMYSIKCDLFHSIMRFDIQKFTARNSADYISIFNNDIKMIETNYFTSIVTMIRSAAILVASLIIMVQIHPFVSIIAILLAFLPAIVPKLFGKVLSSSTGDLSDSFKKYNARIKDMFSGFEIIKSYAVEKNMNRIHDRENRNVEDKRRNAYGTKANADVATNFIAVGMQFMVYLLAGYFVIQKELSAGDVIAITQLMSQVVNPVFTIIDEYNNIKAVETINRKVMEIIDYQTIDKISNSILEVNDGICLKEVSFCHENTIAGIHGISMNLERGKKYAIVGESGSGKSTLLKVLLGYYDDYEGQILFDGEDRRKISQESIFQLFSVMHQNVFLFDDTIRNNVTLHKEYDQEKLKDIIEKLGLLEVLERKGENLNSLVTENGNNFSGGEKQRIALARAMVKGVDWLIMDEATSSLDNESLLAVENLILNLEDVTCITVSHRYSRDIMRRYDRIFVLKEGHLCEEGSFDELFDRKEHFYSLYKVFE
ncbi:MAG TPA: ABC transporter ATP-binding protein [Lachnospiraceae bacterium]|nr:ABC transporter ATP-binding protein [Lachnospiraceae bacterium]